MMAFTYLKSGQADCQTQSEVGKSAHQISERMDESMVLMADVLCVPLEEVTSLKNNARRKDKVMSLMT